MRDLQGFDRDRWKTGFTNYRYAIPHMAGGTGRAIYNDVDQVYLGDPAELFDIDMEGAGRRCIAARETAVMLLEDRRSVVEGTGVAVRVALGGSSESKIKRKRIKMKKSTKGNI